jgi:7-cyano-7-deazaguanine reductase
VSDSKDLHLLGKQAPFPDHPDKAVLDTFPNPGSPGGYTITLDCAEFSSLCPVTGQPDYAEITILYRPAKKCVETKSLKYYLASFRNLAAFNEAIVNRILDNLVEATEPVEMTVIGSFGARGGISLTCEANYPRPKA